MHFQMVQVGVLGFALPFIRHVDQIVKAAAVLIAGEDGPKLILVERDHFMDDARERVQKIPGLLAVENAGCEWFHARGSIWKLEGTRVKRFRQALGCSARSGNGRCPKSASTRRKILAN